MNVYIITDSNNNTYYTGKSRKCANAGIRKSPHFSEKLENSKIYRKLSHARSARSNMGTYTKMYNIDILEFELDFLGTR